MPMPVDSADRNWRQKDLPRSSTHRLLSKMSGPQTCTQAIAVSILVDDRAIAGQHMQNTYRAR